MKRVLLKIAYDGTNYNGWQIQNNGITIEEVVNKELRKILGEEVSIIGASRTDSGVHALGNIAVFDTYTKIPPEKISFALNQKLPKDIRVQKSMEVPLTFHPRKVKSIKTYEYKILNSRHDMPIGSNYTNFVYMPLDYKKMRRAARYFKGEHDFAAFCSAGGQAKTTVRKITSIDVIKEENIIRIIVSGNGFLYNMVRIIAGTLIKVGLGHYPPETIKEILASKDRKKSGPKAPAKGLTLVKIKYDKIKDVD